MCSRNWETFWSPKKMLFLIIFNMTSSSLHLTFNHQRAAHSSISSDPPLSLNTRWVHPISPKLKYIYRTCRLYLCLSLSQWGFVERCDETIAGGRKQGNMLKWNDTCFPLKRHVKQNFWWRLQLSVSFKSLRDFRWICLHTVACQKCM